jgi:hypothetical protein
MQDTYELKSREGLGTTKERESFEQLRKGHLGVDSVCERARWTKTNQYLEQNPSSLLVDYVSNELQSIQKPPAHDQQQPNISPVKIQQKRMTK